ncbi:hypothetical protein FC85_GL000493 [Lentilactobacillus diolivorans DSM 14421]|uniref:Uncharacterized protein n=2 Tax=Lentilactobacillus diolivorans TaxID=179838 RepID=A0A0R1S882_9LACO|nr:hypothetical protein FC85_GL000493 [Lentilactobacillus diolivorans DSM 14421]
MGHDLAWDQMAKDNNLVVEDLRGFLSGRSHDIGMYNQLITYVQGRYSLRSLDVQADYRFADHMPLMRKSNLDDHSSNITSLTGISINDYNPQYQYQLPELSDGISKQSVQHITTLNSSVKTITV